MLRVSLVVGVVVFAHVATPSSPAQEDTITYESLLREMVDRDSFARFPGPAYSCHQASSYDRASDAGPGSDQWFANADRGQYVREETNHGRKEWVLMDVDGPGAVVRFWSANPSDEITIRFYLDGGEEPAIAAPFTDLLGGTWRIGAPLSAVRARGWNLYLPIPYAKHCKITADRGDFYYQINYRTYEPGTPAETFSMAVFDRGRSTLRDVIHRLGSVGRYPHPRPAQARIARGTLATGRPVSIDLASGPRAIRKLSVQLESRNIEEALRTTVLRIRFDGSETVWCPVGDFFASGVGVNSFESWWQTVETDGTMTCYWTMPYRESARVALESFADVPGSCRIAAEVGDWKWDHRSMHFHAAWRHQYPISTATKQDWNYIEIDGKGVFMGDVLALVNPTTVWWGEGDEKIYVDGETFPSHFGTGTEDYYGYAWGDWNFFEAPFHAQPRVDGPIVLGHTTVMRSRALDAIPFMKSFRFDLEVWHWRAVEVAYAAATWFYARPGATHNRLNDRRKDALFVAPVKPPHRIKGAREGENMSILSMPGDTEWKLEANWWGAKWSGDAQIWFGCKRVGDTVELVHPQPVQGLHDVVVYATRYPDYGIIQLYVDGEPLGEPIDLYNPQGGLVATGPIKLDTVDIRSKSPVFGIEVVGTNPKATKPGTYFGIDCIVLKPVR